MILMPFRFEKRQNISLFNCFLINQILWRERSQIEVRRRVITIIDAVFGST